ncbi:DNA-processing protein DprA [Paenibacillus sp. GCM10027626]|uniref:DNA-processing protein DprA n=1 Tax=Paenibacillus sp. GCM10027626 TaxID=3273411 RepID=UPI003636FE78
MKKQNDRQRLMMIALHETPGIGWHTIRKIAVSGKWSLLPDFGIEAWRQLGLSAEQAKAAALAVKELDVCAERIQRRQLAGEVHIVTRYDDSYPELLKHIPQPPWVLYAIGRRELLSGIAISIVGTRGPTSYGRRIALELAEGLSNRLLTVVSGMARGIDSVAHEGALRGSGSTIAVLGTPVEHIYPPENRSLYHSIRDQGLLLSETAPGTKLHPGLFPLRNRIIAGLSIGTVVVEAQARSGSLITAEQAQDMNREVFAVPGPVYSPKSDGTNALIRGHGAKLVSGPEHIIEEFHWLSALLKDFGQKQVRQPGDNGKKTPAPLTAEEAVIYHLLAEQARTIDELVELSELPFGLLHSVLINLTIKRMITQHPGSLYSVI